MFDPALATTMGFSAGGMHYVLMGLLAATTIAALKAKQRIQPPHP